MPEYRLPMTEENSRRPRRLCSLDSLARRDRLAKLSPTEIALLVSNQILVDDLKDRTSTPAHKVSYWVALFQEAVEALQTRGDDHQLFEICDELRQQKRFPGLRQTLRDFLDETRSDRTSARDGITILQDRGRSNNRPTVSDDSPVTLRPMVSDFVNINPILSPSVSNASFRTAEENTAALSHPPSQKRTPLPHTQTGRVTKANKAEVVDMPYHTAVNPQIIAQGSETHTTNLVSPVHPKFRQRAEPVQTSRHVRFMSEGNSSVRGGEGEHTELSRAPAPRVIPHLAAVPRQVADAHRAPYLASRTPHQPSTTRHPKSASKAAATQSPEDINLTAQSGQRQQRTPSDNLPRRAATYHIGTIQPSAGSRTRHHDEIREHDDEHYDISGRGHDPKDHKPEKKDRDPNPRGRNDNPRDRNHDSRNRGRSTNTRDHSARRRRDLDRPLNEDSDDERLYRKRSVDEHLQKHEARHRNKNTKHRSRGSRSQRIAEAVVKDNSCILS